MLNCVPVHLKSKIAIYDFTLNRRVTNVCGDSGSGKTLFRELIAASQRTPDVKVSCPVPVVLPPESKITNIRLWLKSLPECVVVVDEDSVWIDSTEFYDEVLNCSIWLLVISRSLKTIKATYSVNEIYKMHVSGKYRTFERMFNHETKYIDFEHVITEDSKSGRKLFEKVGACVVPAYGNANVLNKVCETSGRLLVVVDGANYGKFYRELLPYLGDRVQLLMPESIEQFMLNSTFARRHELVRASLDKPNEYNANDMKTWGRYYTLVMDIYYHDTAGKAYSKGSLPKCLVGRCCFEKEPCQLEYYKVNDKIADMFETNGVGWILEVLKCQPMD